MSITLPSGLTSIGEYAFSNSGLTNVVIPDTVTNIDTQAFIYCFSLTNVFFKGNAPSFGADVFSVDNNTTAYYLPRTTGWPIASLGVSQVLWDPEMQAAGVQNNQFGFNITGTTNIPIVVEASTNLQGASWTALQTCTVTNGTIYFSDSTWSNYPARFYRIRSP
jgi:hypothetical protein